ncbi:hypothetical protein ACXIUT_23970 [Achromobacter denitrificans]
MNQNARKQVIYFGVLALVLVHTEMLIQSLGLTVASADFTGLSYIRTIEIPAWGHVVFFLDALCLWLCLVGGAWKALANTVIWRFQQSYPQHRSQKRKL